MYSSPPTAICGSSRISPARASRFCASDDQLAAPRAHDARDCGSPGFAAIRAVPGIATLTPLAREPSTSISIRFIALSIPPSGSNLRGKQCTFNTAAQGAGTHARARSRESPDCGRTTTTARYRARYAFRPSRAPRLLRRVPQPLTGSAGAFAALPPDSLASVVVTARQDREQADLVPIDQSVLLRDPPRPVASEFMLERLGLADA